MTTRSSQSVYTQRTDSQLADCWILADVQIGEQYLNYNSCVWGSRYLITADLNVWRPHSVKLSVRITWHGNSKSHDSPGDANSWRKTRRWPDLSVNPKYFSQTYDNHVGLKWADNLTLFVCPLPQPKWKLWASEFDLVRRPEYPGPASWWKTWSWPSHHRVIGSCYMGRDKLISDCKGLPQEMWFNALIHPCRLGNQT